jgi:hypothetical protein
MCRLRRQVQNRQTAKFKTAKPASSKPKEIETPGFELESLAVLH